MVTLERRRRPPGLAQGQQATTSTMTTKTKTTTTTSTSTTTMTMTLTSTIDVRLGDAREDEADGAGWVSAETGRLFLSSLGGW